MFTYSELIDIRYSLLAEVNGLKDIINKSKDNKSKVKLQLQVDSLEKLIIKIKILEEK